MKTKYYKEGVSLSASMWFKLLDKNGKTIVDYPSAACYGSISGGTIPKNTAVVDVYRARNLIPYDDDSIARYIYDLNDIGFPVTLVKFPKTPTGTIHFQFYIENYKSKAHLISGLTLLRMMWEAGMAKTLDFYLQLTDEQPFEDKLILLQTAHKTKGSNANGGHAVTYMGNGGNVDKDTLFKRFANGMKVFDTANWQKPLGINAAWKGPELMPCVPTCGDCLYKRQNGIYP